MLTRADLADISLALVNVRFWGKADLSRLGARVRFHVRHLAAMVAVAFAEPSSCNDDGRQPTIWPLLFTLPSTESMITLLFDAKAITIIPPEGALPYQAPAVPLPAALPLFATGLGVLGLLGWRRKRKAAAAA